MRLPWWFPFGQVSEIGADDLTREHQGPNPPQLVDVRTVKEHRRGHVKGATSAPIGSFARMLPALGLDKNRKVIAICLTGHRSIPAVRLLRRQGYDAAQLAGGMRSWRAAKLPEEKS